MSIYGIAIYRYKTVKNRLIKLQLKVMYKKYNNTNKMYKNLYIKQNYYTYL